MHKIFMGLIVLLIATLTVAPAFAFPAPSDDQNTAGVIIGNDNDQVVVSEHTDNNYNGDTEQNAKSTVNGNENDVTTINNNLNINGDVNGATKVVNNQEMTFVLPKSSAYYGLDTGVITDRQILSLYLGQVLVSDTDKSDLQMEGDKFRYTIQSSLPVLAYIVNSNEANRAEFDIDVAPVYDTYLHKYTVGNLDTIYVGKYRSPQQQFEVTIPEAGKYSLVIDTRVAQSLDGRQTPITPDSVDVVYTISKLSNGTPKQYVNNMIGIIDMYPVLEDGKADTSA